MVVYVDRSFGAHSISSDDMHYEIARYRFIANGLFMCMASQY